MSDGFGYINPASFEALTLSWGDTALANEGGSSNVVSGSDSAQSAATALHTAPEKVTDTHPLGVDWGSLGDVWLKRYLGSDVSALEPLVGKENLPTSQKVSFWEENKTLLGSILLVVIGLMILSKALNMLGGEKAVSVIAKVARKGEAA